MYVRYIRTYIPLALTLSHSPRLHIIVLLPQEEAFPFPTPGRPSLVQLVPSDAWLGVRVRG